MAGAACKIIINHGGFAAAKALEDVLLSPLVQGPMLSKAKCDAYLQRLADIDIRAYTGESPKTAVADDGYAKIMVELVAAGVFTAEIWEIWRQPGAVAIGELDGKHHKPGQPVILD